MTTTRNYEDWHRRYDEPGSGLSWRLERVRHHLAAALDRCAGEARVLNVCAGDGRDLFGVLAGRADADRVSAVLLELHPELAQRARELGAGVGAARVEVRTVDAGLSDSYLGAAPADVVVMVGIFGNVTDHDLWRLVAFAPQLCRPGATLIWSRGRRFSADLPGVTSGDLNEEVRAHLAASGFAELAYEPRDEGSRPALGVVRYDGPPVALELGHPLFTFVR